MRILQRFFQLESAGGILLCLASGLALLISNSGLAHWYQNFWRWPLGIKIENIDFIHPTLFWLNDGLMSIFFLVVGLELKREFLRGELSQIKHITLPGIAALGGMIVPALIYSAITQSSSLLLKGWAIPVATDIAFAIGILSLFGKRVPLGLKLFLLSLAIFDDLGAIIIIAFMHGNSINYWALLLSLLIVALLLGLNLLNNNNIKIYLALGFILWLSILMSGLHATLAGVIFAFTLPVFQSDLGPKIERIVLPWVSYVILPLFAFANLNISFNDMSVSDIFSRVSIGVILGLFLGKQLGVVSFAALSVKCKIAKLPPRTSWLSLYGVALVCGIGFTMSLFINIIAFGTHPILLTQARLGIMLGSILSATIGAIFLNWALPKEQR